MSRNQHHDADQIQKVNDAIIALEEDEDVNHSSDNNSVPIISTPLKLPPALSFTSNSIDLSVDLPVWLSEKFVVENHLDDKVFESDVDVMIDKSKEADEKIARETNIDEVEKIMLGSVNLIKLNLLETMVGLFLRFEEKIDRRMEKLELKFDRRFDLLSNKVDNLYERGAASTIINHFKNKSMLTCFLFVLNSIRIAIPVISLFGSAPTFFTLWLLLRLITYFFCPHYMYRIFDDYLYSLYQKSVLFFFEHWVNTKIYFHGDYQEVIKRKENVLFISNHQSSVDWIVANMLAVRQDSLGHIRYILKNDLKWIPLYGFYFQQHGCIYVHRNDKGDLERVEKGIQQIKSDGLPIWLVIFPEGTRYNPVNNQDAIERSRQFAKQKGIPPFDNVLYPRTGATVAAINALKDKLNAVYDVTVMYSSTYDTNRRIRLAAASMTEYLQCQTKELHIHIKRIPIDLIPSGTNEQISNWLCQRFIIKEKLLKHFYDESRQPKYLLDLDSNREGVQAPLHLSDTIFSCIFFLLTTLLLLITPQGRSLYWQICLFGTPTTLLWMHLFPPPNIN
ncbi:unnamed protein product [Rotaria magnacalcarata]|uniref:Phospholipid/glycerol acyltransferase domain-containing protein n=2 Tax=Rotaria magnacalcarata TaxID=392030 RepID=A0A814Z7T3_9BILA|nr:unnamed protein product [Rotaria magnacalcarata]